MSEKSNSKLNYLNSLIKKINVKRFSSILDQVNEIFVNSQKTTKNYRIIGKQIYFDSLSETIIIGDLHGDLNSFLKILNQVKFLEKINHGKNISLILICK